MRDRHPDFWAGLILGAFLGGLVVSVQSDSTLSAFIVVLVGAALGLVLLWAYGRWFSDS
jgi:hypothetical protein